MENKLNELILQFVEEVNILYAYESLDGDETERIAKKVLVELNDFNGNK